MGRLRIVALLLATVVALAVTGRVVAQSPAPGSPAVIDQVSVVIVQLRDPEGGALTPEALDATRIVIDARLAALPAPGATVTVIPEERIRIDLADPSQLEAVTRVATAPGLFRIVGIPTEHVDEVEPGESLPADLEVHEIVAPGHIVHVAVGQDQLGGLAVDLELDAQADDAFDAWAADHFGEQVALVLDDVVVAAPTIQATEFNGQVQISGSFDLPQVQELVAILSGGALPVLSESLPLCLPIACPVPSVAPGASAAS